MAAKWVVKAINEQREWIRQHGNSLIGYVEYYTKTFGRDTKTFGRDVGMSLVYARIVYAEKIYDADMSYLRYLEGKVR